MAFVAATDAGNQFIDATSADGGTVLIREGDGNELGRLAWTILRDVGDADE